MSNIIKAKRVERAERVELDTEQLIETRSGEAKRQRTAARRGQETQRRVADSHQ